MLFPFSRTTPLSPALRLRQGGFTLLEILIAMAAFMMTISASLLGFNMINKTAMANRLYSEATAVAENQVDAILTKGPFDPTRTPQKIPSVLELGTTTKEGVL